MSKFAQIYSEKVDFDGVVSTGKLIQMKNILEMFYHLKGMSIDPPIYVESWNLHTYTAVSEFGYESSYKWLKMQEVRNIICLVTNDSFIFICFNNIT